MSKRINYNIGTRFVWRVIWNPTCVNDGENGKPKCKKVGNLEFQITFKWRSELYKYTGRNRRVSKASESDCHSEEEKMHKNVHT